LQLSSANKNESDLILDLAAIIRSIGINRSTQHALLLGAGASISSGVPSAASCVWEWKRAIFLTKNPGLEAQFAELSLPAVRTKIQRWLDAQNIYPVNDSPEEYGVYIEACYPIADDRKSFFQDKVRQAVPHTGYRLAVKLAEAGIFQSVWTTNFDGLTAKAAAQSKIISAIEVGIDCQQRLPRKTNRNELICVSLHGDYRYDLLKNTPDELQRQEKLLREALIDTLKDTPLLVVGYSGRDATVMEALETAYAAKGTGVLYWCGYGDGPVSQPVKQLLDRARANGRSAYYIQAGGFDDLMLRVSLHCLEGDAAEEVRGLMMQQAPIPTEERVDFTLLETDTCGIIKSNAFQLTPPSEIYEFDLKEWPTGHVWDYFDNCTEAREVVAAPFKGKAYAFGAIDDIRQAFVDRIGDKIERVPISDLDLRIEDGVINSLIRRALVRAMAARTGAKTDGHEFIWDSAAREHRQEGGSEYLIFDAVVIYLRRMGNKSYAVLKPTIRVETTTGENAPEDAERNIKMAILGWQHNNEFNVALESWRRRILKKGELFEFPPNCGSPFRFEVIHASALAKIMSPDRTKRIKVQDRYKPHIRHAGIELKEPDLIFSNGTGTATVTDPHPVRGIINNKPFDYSLSARKLTGPIQIGVICPAKEANKLSEYLQRLHQPIAPGRFEADYLPAFNGFQNAFGTELQVPAPGDRLWLTCPEIDASFDEQRGALQLSQYVTTCLSALKAAALPNITIIFIPTRWARWRKFETDSERFDLHDFVKAFCVPQGIATQFLEEDTLENELQCRIRWWLCLALYVKSMRTPWVLSSLDTDSAFVGLGISLDRKAQKGNQVILGCSHLYNAHGQGLQFRLSKIEDPVFRNKNTFMSYEDARRVGETIRQLFWESRFRLPGRVVIHKQTPFMSFERKGLQAGLSGVKHIDLLEIHIDSALRYLASIPQANDTFKVDGFPVKRGTLLRLDNDSALLWVHGVSRAINPRFNYYQGKRRIPAPLVIRRHSGSSDLRMIGEEILGLSKMNWNSFDLYAKLPATVETSKQIARIGALFERFAGGSYDYRLFM
jgi:hypothetical protein